MYFIFCGSVPSKTTVSDIRGIRGIFLLIACLAYTVRKPVGTVLHN